MARCPLGDIRRVFSKIPFDTNVAAVRPFSAEMM
jgi:hypothetical protein